MLEMAVVAVAIIFLVGIATLAVLELHISLDDLTIDLDIPYIFSLC